MHTRETCSTESWRSPQDGASGQDDLAQCAVGRQTAVIMQMVEAAEITTFACDRFSPVLSPKSTICCSDVKTDALDRSRHGRTRKTCGWSDEETPVQSHEARGSLPFVVTPKRLPVSTIPTSGHAPALELWILELRPPPCNVSGRALRVPCVPSLAGVSRPVLPSV